MKLRCTSAIYGLSVALWTGALLVPTVLLAQVAYVLPELLPPPAIKASAKKNGAKNPGANPSEENEPLMIPVPTVRLTLGLADMPAIQGIALERPQSLTVLRNRLTDEVPPQSAAEPEKSAQPESAEGTSPAESKAVSTQPQSAQGNPSPIPTIQPQRTEHLSALEESTAFGAPAWITEVAMPHAGVHHFIMETKPTWTPAQNRFVQHVAKTLQPSQNTLELWDKTSDLDFEILPLTRPFNLCEGMSFTGQVVRNGQPVANTLIEAVWLPDMATGRKKNLKKLESTEQLIKTNNNGVFTITCPWVGWWGFSAVTSGGDPLKDPDGNLKPVDLKTTLWVPISTCSPGTAS